MVSYEEEWELTNLELIEENDPDLKKIEEVMEKIKKMEDGEN